MLRTTLRSLWSHKLRLVLTMVSIVLGVAFLAGTLVLNSTVGRVFDDLFATLGENVDAVVRGKELYTSQQGGTERELLSDEVVDEVLAVPGVAAAEGDVTTVDVTVIDSKGDPLGGFGPPTIVGSWTSDRRMASYQVASGRAPTKAGEAIIDRSGAKKGGFSIGDRIEVIGVDGTSEDLTLVGISRFGEADSAGGSIFVGTVLTDAQRLAGDPGKLNHVNVLADDGVTPEQLVDRLEEANLAPGVDIVTGAKASAEQASDVKQGLGFFTTVLKVFAFVALFVALFIVSNTFSILISQRARELALLRAIGASRRQVLMSTLTEAVIIGVVSSIVGFLAGIALAFGALKGLAAAGVDLPDTSLLVTPSAGVYVLVVGLSVTLASAIFPAIKATRVPPIAALRSTAIETKGSGRVRLGAGILALVLGLVFVRPAFSRPPTDAIPGIGIGLGLVVLAVILLGPTFARPMSRVVGSWLPLVKGVIGRMARENAMRSPRRTASTAAALIIGVALVVFISVIATSFRATIDEAFDSGFNGDYLVTPANQASDVGADPSLAEKLAQVPGVAAVDPSGAVGGQIELPDGTKTGAFLFAIDPTSYVDLYNVDMAEGELTDLVPGTIVVDKTVANQYDLAIGDQVTILGSGGRQATFRISALSNDPVVLNQWTINREDITELAPAATDVFISIRLEPGVSLDSVRLQLRAVVGEYKNMKLQDKDQFRNGLVGMINALLNVILGLLAVSVLIAFIGIMNTMLLAVHERTRELGLLRAVGMTKAQMRAAVRWEAVIVALIGTGVGIGLGLTLSYVLVRALESQGVNQFAVPTMRLVIVAVAAVVSGILAAAWPAHKASKLDILDSIATE
ncbi:MAG: ABC transporter permease [Actinobacteria bacterium]|nr:ABC transporter permease [Actinomycetota bacterium]